MDDILIFGNNNIRIQKLQQALRLYFHMEVLGAMTYFPGLEIDCSECGIMLIQTKYTKELIDMTKLANSKLVEIPMVNITKIIVIQFLIPLNSGSWLANSFIWLQLGLMFHVMNIVKQLVWSEKSSFSHYVSHQIFLWDS